MSKPFFASKLNWLGIVTFVAGLGAFAKVLPEKYGAILLSVAGLATVILRTFGTSTSIDGVTPK